MLTGKPDIVVILTGAYDLVDDPTNMHNEPTVANLETMVNGFTAAKIPVLVCLLPLSSEYDNYYVNGGIFALNQIGVFPDDLNFDIDTADQMTAGVDFTTFGLQQVLPLTYQEIQSFGLGGTK